MKARMMQLGWAVLGLFPLQALSQIEFSGTIRQTDSSTISNAHITLLDSPYLAESDDRGLFQFQVEKAGRYRVIVRHPDFAPKSFPIDLNAAMEMDIFLVPLVKSFEDLQIYSTRAQNLTPTTFTDLSKKEIECKNFGQDLPYLLESTPATVVTSDAGAGVGYTSVRIRGVDPTRTNVTINGIPINDAESHGTFWVNMPDFSSSTHSIQVQRGVGTSTNGAAAFGASLNVKSDNLNFKPYGELDNSFGSYGTLRNTIKAGTGLINSRFIVEGRVSRIVSDGFVDRAASKLLSGYFTAAYVGKKSSLKFVMFGGKERTYQAWNGVPQSKFEGDTAAMMEHFNRNYYPGGTYSNSQDSVNFFESDSRRYNYYLYKNEVDNYNQTHYQLHFSHVFSSKWNLNASGHYTRGFGYYEQFRRDDKFSTYGFDPINVNGTVIDRTDLIRRRWLDNHFYGMVFSANYQNKGLTWIIGGGANNYTGGHFGEVIWARFASNSEMNHVYYSNDAQKWEANIYTKANYQWKKWNFFADLQVRHIEYSYVGFDENQGELVALEQRTPFTFFNPKAGLSYAINANQALYASYAMANREPARTDFVESSAASRPTPEQLHNIEAGYRINYANWRLNSNVYYMHYNDQLILTGQLNDVGAYTRMNVDKSYRMGLEVDGAYQVVKQFSINGNIALSRNKIVAFNEYIDNYDNYDDLGNMIQDVVEHKNTDIAFSPSLVTGLGFTVTPIKHFNISWFTKYVGKQYLDNAQSVDRMLRGYSTSSINMNYTIYNAFFKEIQVGVLVNNVFNKRYANNGYTWGYVSGGQRVIENFVFAQAGTNFMARILIKL